MEATIIDIGGGGGIFSVLGLTVEVVEVGLYFSNFLKGGLVLLFTICRVCTEGFGGALLA